jgi:hypothetical protein
MATRVWFDAGIAIHGREPDRGDRAGARDQDWRWRAHQGHAAAREELIVQDHNGGIYKLWTPYDVERALDVHSSITGMGVPLQVASVVTCGLTPPSAAGTYSRKRRPCT